MIETTNLGAVSNMGEQFKENVFKKAAKYSFKAADIHAKNQGQPATITTSGQTNFRATTAPTRPPRQPIGALPAPAAPRAVSSGFTGAPALPPGTMITTPYQQGATPHSMVPSTPALPPGRYRGIATPYTAPPRVIPMSGNAALTNRVNPNFSFSDNETHAPMNRTQFNQPSTTPFRAASSSIPTPPSAPATRPATPSIPNHSPVQFADVTTRDNSPFPTHEHPTGSSNAILPRLSAAQSQPGRPNQFTVGSRNVRGSGIAAMGSRLEEGLMTRPMGVPAPKRRV